MSIFKAGDKVRIKHRDVVEIPTHNPSYTDEMVDQIDLKKIYTIEDYRSSYDGVFRIILQEGGHQYSFMPQWLELVTESPPPKLESGMKVVDREGTERMFINDQFVDVSGQGGFVKLSELDSELICPGCPEYDIMQILSLPYGNYVKLKGEVLWERKEEEPVQELTVAELEEKLGHKVKIVK